MPGLSIAAFVLLARLLGILQPIEWKAFDVALRWRLPEPTDTRITVITITEDDIQTQLNYPISDRDLAALIDQLQTYDPRVIGIDIFRDKPVGEGYAALEAALTQSTNVIGIDNIEAPVIPPPPMLDENQVGFVDAIVDEDGGLRRSQLAQADPDGNYRFSLTLQIAQTYLAEDGITLENGVRDPETMRFGDAEIPRFYPNTGGYVGADNGGNQALINFRAGAEPFAQVSYSEVISGEVDPTLLQDRALLIGYTAESVKDYVNSGAIANANPSAIPGITIQAHAVSQILSAVYDNRSFIRTFPVVLEYLFILAAGLSGIALARWQRKPEVHLLLVIIASTSWLFLAYLIILASWWLPLVPTLTVFLVNAIALYPFYQAQKQLKSQLNDRDKLIDQTYTTIHNGPLQAIATMLRAWEDDKPAPAEMRSQLEKANQELRGIREVLQQEMRSPSETLVMMGEQSVDLQMPLHTVLYQTYSTTLERYSTFFEPITKIRSFEPMADGQLTGRDKRAICRFLEEALTNIYKYAEEPTTISVTGQRTEDYNIIKIVDNGKGRSLPATHEGFGTQQATRLARQLGGKFERLPVQPNGTCCELRWPVRRSTWPVWSR